MASTSEKIAEVLFDILIETNDMHIDELNTVICNFKTNYNRSYRLIMKNTFICNIISAMEEAIEYSKGMEG